MSTRGALVVGLMAGAVGCLLAVALDVDGPVRATVTVPFLLFGPGLALSLMMGPMSLEARVVVAAAGSVSAATLVSLLLLLVGLWSGVLGVALLATTVLLICAGELRRDPNGPASDPTANPLTPEAELPA